MSRCIDCGAKLTGAEAKHYGDQCEACVLEDQEAMKGFRDGLDNPRLDALFGEPVRTIQ